MGSKIKEIPVQLPKKFDKPDEPWYRYLTLDLILYVFSYTLFHPYTCWILVLCLRAQYTKWGAPEMKIAMAWATLVTAVGIFTIFSDRYAYGRAREVDLSEEVIVITGGVDGLGALLAETYGMRNANVAVLDRRPVDQDEAEEKGVIYYECDVGDAAQVEAVAKEIVEDLGEPTILINNAGIVRPASILNSTVEDVEQTFRANTISHFNTLRTFLPHMLRERRGTIVTVSSVLGHIGAANLSSYCASKAAVLALHESLRAEISQHPDGVEIKTILVAPGQMDTKMFSNMKTPSNFLAPIVRPTDVAGALMKMIEKGDGGRLNVPLYADWIQLLSVLPAGIQSIVKKWSGVDTAVAQAGLVEKSPNPKKY